VIVARRAAHLRVGPVVSDRGCPFVTEVNGTLMARRSTLDLLFPARRARLIIHTELYRSDRLGQPASAKQDERPL
jgi:hypothetical protein